MKIVLGVKKFGKIKEANIDISNFTIFVGNNNSGKSYMMQLIYGVLKEIPRINATLKDFFVEISRQDVIGKDGFKRYEEQVNLYLQKNKEDIVTSIFHRKVSIESLYLKLEDIEEKIFISYGQGSRFSIKEQNRVEETNVYMNNEELEVRLRIALTAEKNQNIIFTFKDWNKLGEKRAIAAQHAMERVMEIYREGSELFLPASRTGLLLLYKYFFSEKKDDTEMGYYVSEHRIEYGNQFGLSEPVYDFLRFLMRHTPNEMLSEHNRHLIRFIENYLIDGTVIKQGEEEVYTPQGSELTIPLYLASSMVNELTPILRMLTGNQSFRTILYDEIETCLHPSKQSEMARLLIRLNNHRKRLIVSTHSDTMATKINNLLLLSFANMSRGERIGKLQELQLEESDLLVNKNVHVYQFENQEDGTSVVKELEFRKVPYTGYDFSQFMNNAEELYKESLTVME